MICLVLSVPCLIVFLAYEQRTTRQGQVPLVQLSLFRQRSFPAGLLTMMVASGLFAALLFLLAFYLQTILHLMPLQAGLVIMSASISFFLASFLGSVIHTHLGRHSLSAVAALITGGYLLISLSTQWLVPLWGMPPLLMALFLLGLGMGLLSTLLLPRTLEGVAPDDAGAASGVYTTGTQVAGSLGVALIGLVDALTASSGNPLRAFITSVLLIVLLSVGLSLTVLPLAGWRPVSAKKEALVSRQGCTQDNEGETETVHSVEKGTCRSCQNA
jgi:predicted MFS family arabinose efflux permease